MQLVSFSIILLKRACKKGKIIYGRNKKDGFTFHDLRHTFKTNACKADVPELVIIEIADHSTRKMFYCGAEGETRTPTRIHSLDPEPSASTNSATSAYKTCIMKKIALKRKLFYINCFLILSRPLN